MTGQENVGNMSRRKKPRSYDRIVLRLSIPTAAGLVMTTLGGLALVLSAAYFLSTLAFIGLGLVFWGVVLLYIQTDEYVKKAVLNATETSLLTTLGQTFRELGYMGKAVYLPPRYLNTPETAKVYISKQEDGDLPPPEQIHILEARFSPKNEDGILITPPGAELAKLFEDTLETSFTRTSVKYLQENLPKLIIDDLEIASRLELQTEADRPSNIPEILIRPLTKHDTIHVKITSPVFKYIRKEDTHFSSTNETLSSPLTSAIACALAKATGRPVIIQSQKNGEDDETIDIEYSVLEGEQKQP